MNRSVFTALIIGSITLAMTGTATLTTLTNVFASDQEIPCSPPVQDPNNAGMLIERCSGQDCLIDKETGERLSCSSSNQGVDKVCSKDEFGRDQCIQISESSTLFL